MKRYLFIIILAFISMGGFFQVFGQGKVTHRQPATEAYDYTAELERAIIGKWVNVSMRVFVNTYNSSDTSFMIDINEDNWDMKMNIKPIETTIREDGTYSSEFRNSFDSLMYRPGGTWLIDGDTLIMRDNSTTYKYQIFIDGDIAEFRSLLDWDQDGKADDRYFGVQKRIRDDE